MSISGQNYSSSVIVKNGQVRGKQRYRCRITLNNFVPGGGRVDPETARPLPSCSMVWARRPMG